MKSKYVKQLTRENSLLDRSLRTIAYDKSVPEIGRASISKSPVVGHGSVTSLYYDPQEFKRQQQIILSEFRGKNLKKFASHIVDFLERGYRWAKKTHTTHYTRRQLVDFITEFNQHHAHSRGAIVYGYWGEPAVTRKLKTLLSKKIARKDLDQTLSTLSSPKLIAGPLRNLYHPSPVVLERKERLKEKLDLTARELELVEILSWFTLFYELGERISSLLFDELLFHLKTVIANKVELSRLFWYDPDSLVRYLKGKKLPPEELKRREFFYILTMRGKGKLRVLSGNAAKAYFNRFFSDESVVDTNVITGTVASSGKAVGRVKIVITQNDQRTMQKGNILVSTMTTPRLMSAVKKAAAIVTDEGGMTAHAAIVSREFGIPCIVGTKIATKIFKNGDLVEVDATKGTVKKF